ncbi:MAG: hypothetical protein IJK62_08345 [Bacteroidales bacterium]|nr:hypothetical protein [Bacteroidales bacterium]
MTLRQDWMLRCFDRLSTSKLSTSKLASPFDKLRERFCTSRKRSSGSGEIRPHKFRRKLF